MMIPRQAIPLKTEQQGQEKTPQSPTTPVDLSSLRNLHAWVLLGEPGAGKTTAFTEEATACGGLRVSVAEFIHPGNTLDDWQNKVLFLDGLDEITGDIPTTLISIRNNLKKLNHPKFRLSCRAADWQGALCLEKLHDATPAQTEMIVYTLQPLSEEDIQTLVEQHFQRTPEDAKTFLEFAKQHQASDWLGNPQTLEWMLKLPANQWPKTKQALLEQTCERLAQEHNRTHRDKQRQNPAAPSLGDLLAAAGELFAYLLLGNKQGIALDRDTKTELYPELDDFQPNNTTACAQALKTQLFKPANSTQERVEPIHRRVAEYLAAQYLAKKLDNNTLPLSRLLNVLTGHDGKCIDGLRNLYAWLANCSTSAREYLLKQDPFSLALYGNAESWSPQQTQTFLEALKPAISKDPYLLHRGHDNNLKNLYRPDLIPHYLEWLRSPERTQAQHAWLNAILEMLELAPSNHTELNSALLGIIKDSSYIGYRLRSHAMDLWLRSNPSKSEIQKLLNAIQNQTISDNDHELMGTLLYESYPNQLSTAEVLQYFCRLDPIEGEPHVYGTHHVFWLDEFPTLIPENELQQTLNTLSQHPLVKSISDPQDNLCELLSTLIARAFTEQGEQATNAQLLDWLMIGMDEHGTNHLESQPVIDWANKHPERYQGLLHEAYLRAEQDSNPTQQLDVYEEALAGFTPPPNMATWHFEQIDQTTHPDLKKEHLRQAVPSLLQSNAGSLTLEQLEQWAANDANKQSMLSPYLQSELDDNWQRGTWTSKKHREEERNTAKANRTNELKPWLPAIEQGTASDNIMRFFANLRNGATPHHGETSEERLKSYCNEPEASALKHAIEHGMPLCLQRDDLPSIKEIIELHIQNKHYFIQPACLLGAELMWNTHPQQLLELPEPTLQTLVCFLLTSHERLKDTTWFLGLSTNHPTLVKNVFITLGKACFKKQKYMSCLDELAYSVQEHPALYALAQQVTLPLLKAFPLRATTTQLEQLKHLRQLAQQLHNEPHFKHEFCTLIAKKLKKKSLDGTQKNLWLLAGLNQNPAEYERAVLEQTNQQLLEQLYKHCIYISNDAHPNNTDTWSTHFVGQLIEHAAQHIVGHRQGIASANHTDDLAHALIQKLQARNTPDSITELERLLALPTTSALQYTLRSALHTAQEQQRKERFKFLEVRELSNILNNKTPVNAADLHAFTLACLDDIAQTIRSSNSDIFRQFWNEDFKSKPTAHKNENSCRDALFELLKNKLNPLGVTCERERDAHNHKRADIQLFVGPSISIPIEIKGEWHKDLWNAIKNQLIPQYTQEKASAEHGIYVVLWVGGTEQPSHTDEVKKPKTPEELETRLREHCIPIEKKSLIEVRVLDVSWPP